MNAVAAVRFYIKKMTEESGAGMKILLLDQETKSIVSVVYSQSEIANKEVYLFDLLENQNRDYMKHMKCLCLIRPTKQNISNLIREIKNPKYGSYYLFFTNTIEKMDLKMLAENDEQEVVREVQEVFSDYLAIGQHVFSVNTPRCGEALRWNEACLKRSTHGLAALLLSLKKLPLIRYQTSSEMCKKLAESIRSTISRDSNLFDFRQVDPPPVLLIVDRREDPVTPMLNQWTYQAMVHELLGIKNNIVNLKSVPGISKELEEVILSAEYDEFYENSMFLNYGEICVRIKELMEDFQKKSQSQAKVESIADMKAFVENYPQFKKMSGTVAKHVTLVGELSRQVTTFNLLEMSEIEQRLACQEDHQEVVQKIRSLMNDQRVRTLDLVRLVSLYALRYEKSNRSEFNSLKTELLRRGGLNDLEREFMNKICSYSGARFRETDLFANQNTMAITKRILKGFKGVDNIYTQHTPLVKELVEQLIKGKLREASYPFLTSSGPAGAKDRPQEIIVFVVGGITYEETQAIHNVNKAYAGNIKVLIGGTHVHNFRTFIDEVLAMTGDAGGTINTNETWQRDPKQNAHVKKSLATAMRD